ncbi:hypothetical protein BC832DRAFT_355447 [Gaertneriomyces semiglobifer]|nr:hypothetical protein BC832DRAFT_355447 [Gaertneriomyces semiglobifer]
MAASGKVLNKRGGHQEAGRASTRRSLGHCTCLVSQFSTHIKARKSTAVLIYMFVSTTTMRAATPLSGALESQGYLPEYWRSTKYKLWNATDFMTMSIEQNPQASHNAELMKRRFYGDLGLLRNHLPAQSQVKHVQGLITKLKAEDTEYCAFRAYFEDTDAAKSISTTNSKKRKAAMLRQQHSGCIRRLGGFAEPTMSPLRDEGIGNTESVANVQHTCPERYQYQQGPHCYAETPSRRIYIYIYMSKNPPSAVEGTSPSCSSSWAKEAHCNSE